MKIFPQSHVYMYLSSACYSMLNKITDRIGDKPITCSMVSMVTVYKTERLGDGPILSIIQPITIDTMLKNTGLNNGRGTEKRYI